MKLIASVASFALVAGLVTQEAAPPTPEPGPVAALDWLEGAWQCEIWGGTFVSIYTPPDGDEIHSSSKLIVDGDVAMFEFERFWADGEGAVWMTPHPGGVPKLPFALTAFDRAARRAVFEHDDNDFPTRIVYRRVSEDRLEVVLDDPHGESDEVHTFDFRRPGAAPTERR